MPSEDKVIAATNLLIAALEHKLINMPTPITDLDCNTISITRQELPGRAICNVVWPIVLSDAVTVEIHTFGEEIEKQTSEAVLGMADELADSAYTLCRERSEIVEQITDIREQIETENARLGAAGVLVRCVDATIVPVEAGVIDEVSMSVTLERQVGGEQPVRETWTIYDADDLSDLMAQYGKPLPTESV